VTMPLHFRFEASYVLRACNAVGCTDSAPVSVVSSLSEAVGYFKASNTGSYDDWFGYSLATSGDGDTLVVGAFREDSNATGLDGDDTDESAGDSGAVYIFTRDALDQWSQQAYVKASNTGSNDRFGFSVALSSDGNNLAVGAPQEDGNATGIGGNETDDSAVYSGAVYVFVRDAMGQWSQQAYVKASNTGANDSFGCDVSLTAIGDTLAVGALGERSAATGIDGDQADDSSPQAGAVYVFVRDGMDQWSQQAYVKASNTSASDFFGYSIALSDNGTTLAVGAHEEDSGATGIDGDQFDSSATDSGAVYVFVRDAMSQWSQQAYIKASNTGGNDRFGWSVALSGFGNVLAVGAVREDSSAIGIDGDQADDSIAQAGAVYVFARDLMDQWSQQAYVKASNPGPSDLFGIDVALSIDGNTLAVGAHHEDGDSAGLGGDPAIDSAFESGAVYVFVPNAMDQWSQQAYVKASNPSWDDEFGFDVELNGDGSTLAVGGYLEDSHAVGIGGEQANESVPDSGAVYLY
jgi:hypothetical protein